MVTDYTGGEDLTEEQLCSPEHVSDYAAICFNLVRDAWDPITKTVISSGGYLNDSLDHNRQDSKCNCKWSLHDTNKKVLIYRATKKVPRGAQFLGKLRRQLLVQE